MKIITKTPTQQTAKPSVLRHMQNLVIGVKDHDGRLLKDTTVLCEHFDLWIDQGLLEDAVNTRAGQFLLRILGAVNHAGKQGRPAMLIGRKQATGGFAVQVTVPIDTTRRTGATPTMQGPGVTRTK